MKHISLRRLAAVIIGIVFLIAGLIKLSDPVGAGLKVAEYFKFFHLRALLPAARAAGITLALLESSLGVALITGVLRKFTAWATTALLGFFTLVTLILWIFNPSMDCGCFGEAVHLSHAKSFWKNVVLLVLAGLSFFPFGDFGKTPRRKIVSACIAVTSLVLATIYANTHLPLVDFTDFHLGSELFASLEDDLAADNHYLESRVYEKDGKQGRFYPGYYPSDMSWKLVQTDTVFWKGPLSSDIFPILSFRNAEDVYLDRMAAEGQVMVFSVYDPAKAPWERLQRQFHAVEEAGALPLLLVACAPSQVDDYAIPYDLTVYYADYKTLIALNRDNGGCTYFYEGELIEKWMSRDFPKDLPGILAADPVNLSTYRITRHRLTAQGFCLYLAALLALV